MCQARELVVMMNVMRTLINLSLRAGWNTWYGETSSRRRIEEARRAAAEKTNKKRCHYALRTMFETMIDSVVEKAAAWRRRNIGTVRTLTLILDVSSCHNLSQLF